MIQAAPEAVAALRRERLDPEILATLEARAGITPDAETSLAETRAAYERETPVLAGTGPAMAEERRLELRGPDGQPLRVATFRPPAATATATGTETGTGPLPLVVYFHGGGWVVGSVETSAPVCRALAVAAGAVVASVDYRLAPEHPYPAALEDAVAATGWLADHAEAFGADPRRLGVAGDSAGGNLAAVLARRLRDDGARIVVSHQALIYPVCDAARDTGSYAEFADGWGLTAEEMAGFWAHYAGGADPADPNLSPGRADDLAGLPPAFVLTAECDVLRDEGEAYGERLRAAGVPVALRRHPGTVHGFTRWLARTQVARRAVTELGAEVSAALRA